VLAGPEAYGEAMQRFTEWDINYALHVFFSHNREYMLIFQDADLHVYTDRHLIPMTALRPGNKKLTRPLAKTLRGRYISVDPQQFRPDAVLLSRDGQPHVLETKVGRVNTEAECATLVVQTLVYADLVISPRWKPETRCQNIPASTTYDLLEDLHEAHWFLKVLDEGQYRPVEERHQRHFGLRDALSKEEFERPPAVVFLLERMNRDRLEAACKRVKDMDFQAYREHAESVLWKGVAFRKHLPSLERNWAQLQQIRFALMRVDTSKFTTVIQDGIEFL
jgi:hypothetical protein